MLADTAGRWPKVEEDTADFRYVRLHGDAELYTSGYDDEALDAWAARIEAWDDAQDVVRLLRQRREGVRAARRERLIERLGPAEPRTR